jgi:penicillin V acylase-like amidase (Ntn superfamily)
MRRWDGKHQHQHSHSHQHQPAPAHSTQHATATATLTPHCHQHRDQHATHRRNHHNQLTKPLKTDKSQVENARHASWKRSNQNPAFTLPGAFYPDERFLRIEILKGGMPKPSSYDEAVMQAVQVLNSVTVPQGAMGTDSSAGEGQLDHTWFGVCYDHLNTTMYWRTLWNQNLQRVRLQDAHLAPGEKQRFLILQGNDLPWFNDASAALAPI